MAFQRTIGLKQPHIDRKLAEQHEEKFTALPAEKNQIEQFILEVAGKAFRRYAKAHGANPEMEKLECQRYLKILKEML